MSRTVIVRYETHADQADANQALIEQVFTELHAERPEGIRYAAFRLDAGAGTHFVHVATTEDGSPGLPALTAFAEFQRGIADRVVAPPESGTATAIGAYDPRTP